MAIFKHLPPPIDVGDPVAGFHSEAFIMAATLGNEALTVLLPFAFHVADKTSVPAM
jgi:hypothetical protein